ncbi:hypothetical protein BKK79_20060 [Cupriavidus sp. USMAA2-4]|uniref:hypothetical protein n=1 Tax=Cupriavidus sp. USMAA2-4 TaxID=876364 RepID=UPI0008A6E3DB|nr:hypothetical protein [Cupriavidus sp. USMAA2-4]AOY90396.1 hypothetical protein BKK79_00065 [Cupriavidus sp. USMAA2-4]AOY93842.1 hypothetical protein BKK79_20060 [Cupriavidus sp. USMAA2-4]
MTTYFDYYLRGPDRDTTRAALLAAGLTVDVPGEDGQTQRMPAEGVNISTIGTIYEGGEWGADGTVITAPTAVPGWHVNLRLDRPLSVSEQGALDGMLIEPLPATPYRVWA